MKTNQTRKDYCKCIVLTRRYMKLDEVQSNQINSKSCSFYKDKGKSTKLIKKSMGCHAIPEQQNLSVRGVSPSPLFGPLRTKRLLNKILRVRTTVPIGFIYSIVIRGSQYPVHPGYMSVWKRR